MTPLYPPREYPKGLYITINNLNIINLVRYGKSTKEISVELGISTSTVNDQLCSIYKKLGVDAKEGLQASIEALNLDPLEDVGVLLHTNGKYELKAIPKSF